MRVAIAALLGLLLAGAGARPAAVGDVALQRVGRFAEPVYVAGIPGSRRDIVVVERYGRIRLVRQDHRPRTFADLRSRVRVDDPRVDIDQRGLFSVAFPPDHRRTGRFYVQYVDRRGRLRVDELRRGRRAVRRVLDLGRVGAQHHGGQLQFGPDGRLYVSTGMDDEPTISQDPLHPGGKILRVDVRRPDAAPEVYALGLRNPWRFSFDRLTGSLLIGDVGQDRAEEIDVIAPGALPGTNFGWPAFEGHARRAEDGPSGATAPALELRHADGWCAVTGGYVVRNRRLPWYGRYVYGDLCSGRLYAARLRGGRLGQARRLRLRVPYLVSFGEDASGRLYAVSLGGMVYRFVPR